MGRFAITKNDVEASEADAASKPASDSYAEQILKYIPAEVVAFYIPAIAAANALIDKTKVPETLTMQYNITVWVIFFAGLIGTIVYMYKIAKKGLDEERILASTERAACKAGISAFAFLLWALYVGGPFETLNPEYQTYGVIGILLFTLAAPGLYDLISDYFTPPSAITIEVTESTPEKGVKKVNVTNRGLNELTVKYLHLYAKRSLGWHRFFLAASWQPAQPEKVKKSTKTEIDLKQNALQYSKNDDKHFLLAVIGTDSTDPKKEIVIESDPFSKNSKIPKQ